VGAILPDDGVAEGPQRLDELSAGDVAWDLHAARTSSRT
jgi:hypothetical protein